jgi:hypothetical protein
MAVQSGALLHALRVLYDSDLRATHERALLPEALASVSFGLLCTYF